MVTIPNQFGKLSLEELNDFEKANQMKLPADYREFLLTYNGGKLLKDKLQAPANVIAYILGMHSGDYYASLYKHIDMFAKRIPFNTFPIATDPFGNLFIMSMHQDNYGQYSFGNTKASQKFQTVIT